MIIRHHFPPEKLTRDRFVDDAEGACRYCNAGTEGRPPAATGGVVKMERDMNTFLLSPHKCMCLLCGQHYYIEYEDLEIFLGYSPSLEGLEPYPLFYTSADKKFRSIDDEWKPSLQLPKDVVE